MKIIKVTDKDGSPKNKLYYDVVGVLYKEPVIGQPFLFIHGDMTLKSSLVVNWERKDGKYIIETLNSIYEIEEGI